ncbi:MAG: CO dehydrogenase/CO-methylating acetyl-CoA synthase complex subunit beta [Syntrophales bacterium]|nr:CO dehydrogenase/CO-methylating acetyl-CoA synthase complex subunit beta [Syntrophales bacterium]
MSEFHVDIGPQYEGEAIRKEDLYVEFGGPKISHKFEWARLKSPEEVEHEKVEIIGPDLKDLEEGGSYPLAILIDVAGEELEPDMEPVIERRIHMYANYIEGFWHIAQRNDIWLRLSKNSYKKGLNSLKEIGEMLIFLYTSEIAAIENISITFITDEKKVEELLPEALKVYEARDKRALGLKDEDVDEFYCCVLCQSFAPTHSCIIVPSRLANCGAMNWFDCKAAYKLDPEGPIFGFQKGECLDPIKGEYGGADDVVKVKSLGNYDKVYLHSAFEHPHTSCGCFQAICFYIPEVDAFGIIHRDYTGLTPAGVKFSSMAGATSGGKQVEGFCGLALELLRSPKFFQADGGRKRLVWLPKDIKERYREPLEADGVYDKIATEEDVKSTDELAEFLERVGHPWVKGEVELPG